MGGWKGINPGFLLCWITSRRFLEWIFVKGRWNILARIPWVYLVQWRTGGGKSVMGQSHMYFSIFLNIVLKGTLVRTIFKWVPLFIKCNIFWRKRRKIWRECASKVIMQHALTQKSLSSFYSNWMQYLMDIHSRNGILPYHKLAEADWLHISRIWTWSWIHM